MVKFANKSNTNSFKFRNSGTHLIGAEVVDHVGGEGRVLEPVPFHKERSCDEAEESGLDLGHGGRVAVAHWRHGKAQTPFQVALAVKLLGDLETPGAAHLPRPARIANVGAFQRNLQHKVTVLRTLHVQRLSVQIVL